MEDEVTMRDVVIIGSGPAGLTAAIYLARANLKPVIIEGMMAGGTPPGGQLMTTGEVENFPGFPEGITGPDLMDRMRQQADRFDTEFFSGDVSMVEPLDKGFKLTVDEAETIETKALVVCTGATARYLGLQNEQRLIGRGVSGCATCDGAFFKDQDVIVVGGGDTAMEDALYLARICKSVKIVHRRDALRASHYMGERAKAHEKIDFFWDSVVVDVVGDQTVTGIKLRNVKTDEEQEAPCTGVFIAIGHTPNSEVVKNFVETDESGYILTEGASTRTSFTGIFAAGDIMDSTYRQAVSAAGAGCKAALDVERYLESWEE
jgi:thioredoxin reductase (NADPH)